MKIRILKEMILGALLLCLALGTSCAEVRQPDASDAEVQEQSLRFLHIWQEHSQTMEAIVRGIEAENEGLHVEIHYVGWEDLSRELNTAIASDNMYDVFFQFASQVSSTQKAGLLLELDDYLDEEWAGRFQNGALEEYSVDGVLYGLPYRGSGVVVVYNRDLFKRNGWRIPATQQELSALMQLALREGLVPMAIAGKPDGFELDSLRGIVTNYIVQQAGLLDDPEGLVGRKTNWQGELAMGAQTVKDWANRDYFGANPLSVDRAAAQDRFLSGKAAMLLCNTNELYLLRTQTSYMPFAMGSFLIPGFDEDSGLIFSGACFQDGFGVWAQTEHPDQAAALLRGLTSPENAAFWADQTYSVMATKNLSYEDELLQVFSGYFSIADRYRVVPDYALGTSNDLKSQLFVDFMSSGMTADAYESNYETITKNAIASAERH